MVARNILLASASASTTPPPYSDDVFAAVPFKGTGDAKTIKNNIDLATYGGMVWSRNRDGTGTGNNRLIDSALGLNTCRTTINANAPVDIAAVPAITSFNVDGYSMPASTYTGFNDANANMLQTTFRKAPKFFDIVKYTGDGTPSATGVNYTKTINHSLGITPGMIIIQNVSTGGDWYVWHRGQAGIAGGTNYAPPNDSVHYPGLMFNKLESAGTTSSDNVHNVTASSFTVANWNSLCNVSGAQYVAYIFAHDPSDTGIIQCGTFTGNTTTKPEIVLGWEPQYVLGVAITSPDIHWSVWDSERCFSSYLPGNSWVHYVNVSNQDYQSNAWKPTETGFAPVSGGTDGVVYMYMAIRRPNKPRKAGTDVFNAISRAGTSSYAELSEAGFSPDLIISKGSTRNGSYLVSYSVFDKKKGINTVGFLDGSSGAMGIVDGLVSFNPAGFNVGADSYGTASSTNKFFINNGIIGNNYTNWCFKRSVGVFDSVYDVGTATAKSVTHKLGAIPELIWRTPLNAAAASLVMPIDFTKATTLTNSTIDPSSIWGSSAPTATTFNVDGSTQVNNAGEKYMTYLFASKAGISKIGTYAGNGTSQTIDCGFSTGARFILIKPFSGGYWLVWDSVRGIAVGNAPYWRMASNDLDQVIGVNCVSATSVGFNISELAPASINTSGRTYLFMAIA